MSGFKRLMSAPGMNDASEIPADATHIAVDGDGCFFTWCGKPDWFASKEDAWAYQNEWGGLDSGAAIMNHMGEVTGFESSTS